MSFYNNIFDLEKEKEMMSKIEIMENTEIEISVPTKNWENKNKTDKVSYRSGRGDGSRLHVGIQSCVSVTDVDIYYYNLKDMDNFIARLQDLREEISKQLRKKKIKL